MVPYRAPQRSAGTSLHKHLILHDTPGARSMNRITPFAHFTACSMARFLLETKMLGRPFECKRPAWLLVKTRLTVRPQYKCGPRH